MPVNEVHLGDIGTSFRLTIKDQDEAVVDISGATTKKITFEKPSGDSVEKNATFVTDGTDGKMEYVTVSGDLDETGWWRYQGYVVLGAGEWHTDIFKEKIYANI